MHIGDIVYWNLNNERVQITGITKRRDGDCYLCTMITETGPQEKVFYDFELSPCANQLGFCNKKGDE